MQIGSTQQIDADIHIHTDAGLKNLNPTKKETLEVFWGLWLLAFAFIILNVAIYIEHRKSLISI